MVVFQLIGEFSLDPNYLAKEYKLIEFATISLILMFGQHARQHIQLEESV